MRVIVCDDEPLARQRLVRMLARLAGVECVGEAANGVELLAEVDRHQPDVVITDIRMPAMDGLEAAARIATRPSPPAVVFCTAYDEHALHAFQVQAIGYLLKPVKLEDLESALRQARRLAAADLRVLEATPIISSGNRRDAILARTHRGIERIRIDDIRYFMADHKYVTVHHGEGEVLIDEALKDLEHEFAGHFVRIHRNSLINIDFLEAIDYHHGHAMVRLRDVSQRLPVSRRLLPGLRRAVERR